MKVKYEDMRLYAVTDRSWLKQGETLEDVLKEVLPEGITFLQLREKHFTHEEMVFEGKKIKKLTDQYHIPFIINDDVLAAKEIDADGVHIGQSDAKYQYAREILGPDKIIGLSAHNVEEALEAQNLGADYIGVGAVFGSSTKTDAKNMSKETLLAITNAVSIPVVAIGGITFENMDYLKDTGVNGVAVISSIFAKEDPKKATKDLSEKTKKLFGAKQNA